VDKILFTVVATPSGNPIDLTACDGTSNAKNTCVISLTTTGSYLNNVKWATKFSGDASDNILKPGNQCQITIDTTDLGSGTLSDNITINSKFSVEVKPSVGATVTIQRTCPAAISGVMDLN
jgi:archaellin